MERLELLKEMLKELELVLEQSDRMELKKALKDEIERVEERMAWLRGCMFVYEPDRLEIQRLYVYDNEFLGSEKERTSS